MEGGVAPAPITIPACHRAAQPVSQFCREKRVHSDRDQKENLAMEFGISMNKEA